MDNLIGLLVPLVFFAIVVINIIVRMKEFQKRQAGGEEGQKKKPWSYLANPDELRKFIEQASRGGATGTRPQAPPPPVRPQPGAPRGMPVGRVTPTESRTRRQTVARPRRVPSAPQQQKRQPGERLVERETHAKTEKSHVRQRGSQVEHRKFEAGLEERFRKRDETEKKRRMKPTRPAAAVTPAAPTAPTAPVAPETPGTLGVTVEESQRLVPEITRANLRRAIVMSEVLGRPIGLR